jgi:hypothetical protein
MLNGKISARTGTHGNQILSLEFNFFAFLTILSASFLASLDFLVSTTDIELSLII